MIETSDRLFFTPEEVERSLPERFARVVASRPAALALAAGNERLTYTELDQRTNTLAAAIAGRAPLPAGPVATLLSDPISAIIGLLATWKAGRPCAVLDAGQPSARLEVVLRHAEAQLVITDDHTCSTLDATSPGAVSQLRLDEIDPGQSVEPPRVALSGDSLACLLYTSGSTGEPKAVARTHRGLLHLGRGSINSLGIRPHDRVSALHSVVFGTGMRDLLATLLAGASVLPFDLRTATSSALASWIKGERISVLSAVVTTFRHLLATVDDADCLASVRLVRLGSEPLYRADVERFRERFPRSCSLVLGYGTTEIGVGFEYAIGPETPLPAGRVPAGYPFEGVEILLLDEEGRPVADGETGEIAVRSRYLAAGYWRQPELTHEKFREDPVEAGSSLYLTGDMGVRQPDGCLDVLGRKDHQLKVRGYRVHPGEVELAVAGHPRVREAVVVAGANRAGETNLHAFLVSMDPFDPSTSELRRFLLERLPTYMVPATFTTLKALPVNANGKVDRDALRPPDPTAAAVAWTPPSNPLEQQLIEIWETVLDIRPIGTRDDFFDLGGDSLLAAAVMAAIQETCGQALSPAALFDAPTVAELAGEILRTDVAADPVKTFRASGDRTPLVFLHGDYNGGGLYCHGLARALDPDRPFYAVHPHGLDRGPIPSTIEAMAADRLSAVRAVRPRGPYVLGGHCNGGLVALEMARLLRAQGERVELVALVDAEAPTPLLRRAHRISDALGRLRGLSTEERRALFGWVEIALERATARRDQLWTLGQAAAGAVRRPLAFVERRVTRARRRKATRNGGSDAWALPVSPPPELRLYLRAFRRYMPSSYGGPVTLFRSDEGPARPPDLGWSSILPGLGLVAIPGDHFTCVTRHVAALGARLEEVMAGAP